MTRKSSAVLVLLLVIVVGSTAATGQEDASPRGAGQTAPPATAASARTSPTRTAPAAAASKKPGSAAAGGFPESGTPDYQPAHITIATPAPAPAAWPWQDRITWAANLVLVILGYAGIMLLLSTLKKIERQTQYAEEAAHAAAASAQAALLHAQAIERAERPWIVITVEPSRRVENRFIVMATNRGRGPAKIISAVEKITTEADQAFLPDEPQYDDAEPNASLASVILLPGESTGIKSFSREDVREYCGSDEKVKRVENWDELILLYGKILYEDLNAASGADTHETSWCCWYIHGRQDSGMVMAGSAAYNRHT